jgi:AcrR family transcriptional regulator
MKRPVNASPRPSLRAQQTALTRQRVLDAAHQLFVERGYALTTVAAIASEAGVSPETIYASLGGKRGLLEGVIDATILGPEAVPLSEQSVWDRIESMTKPRDRLRVFVEFVCDVLARTSPVHAVIRGAADSEEFAVGLRERLLAQRLADIAANLARTLPKGLKQGLTRKEATERFAALASPELRHLLVAELGWTPRRHRQWLVGLLERELLDE